ncbi:NAD-binding protein [Streptomyces mirabilis]|nr:NAD-binding protein [Streptomyces mirabilis]
MPQAQSPRVVELNSPYPETSAAWPGPSGVAVATRVAVVGGGQSALESAALLNEAGADVEVLVRDSPARWGMRPQLQRP